MIVEKHKPSNISIDPGMLKLGKYPKIRKMLNELFSRHKIKGFSLRDYDMYNMRTFYDTHKGIIKGKSINGTSGISIQKETNDAYLVIEIPSKYDSSILTISWDCAIEYSFFISKGRIIMPLFIAEVILSNKKDTFTVTRMPDVYKYIHPTVKDVRRNNLTLEKAVSMQTRGYKKRTRTT